MHAHALCEVADARAAAQAASKTLFKSMAIPAVIEAFLEDRRD